ncbi:MAG: phage tail sheath C-terminal domain-containing protein [Pseudomonadota bacterium]
MPTYKTPGVFIEEVTRLPPSVTGVATAVPAFMGFTEQAVNEKGEDLTDVPTRITSLKEYELYFGRVPAQTFAINVMQRQQKSDGRIIDVQVTFATKPPRVPAYLLYYSMQMFFANGGSVCYVVSIGNTSTTAYDPALFVAAFDVLAKHHEPTLYVFPDACSHRAGFEARDVDVGMIITAALQSCAHVKNRFTICDVRNALSGGTVTNADVDKTFRTQISSSPEILRYGAVYFPYLETSINFVSADNHVTIASHTVVTVADDGSESSAAGHIAANTTLDVIRVAKSLAIYDAAHRFISLNSKVTLPPSGAIAGVYAQVDTNRGVWKAPANVSVALVEKPALMVDEKFGGDLNVDLSGKSVNTIRAFAGRGIRVWGARTLAGNDNEWRYVSVRRFCNFIEGSVTNAIEPFVFEPNDANTWIRVRGMIENFLFQQWQQGALMGNKPEEAFYVRVGLNQTMTANDVLEGRMIVEIGLAVVRPAEFIVLRFMLKMLSQ